jgi:hypothetical protein
MSEEIEKRMTSEDPLYPARKAACEKLDSFINEFLDEYELYDGEVSHTPSDLESLLIADAVAGLHSQDEFVQLWADWRALCTPLLTKDEHAQQLARIEVLVASDPAPGSIEFAELNRLAEAVERYEKHAFPMLSARAALQAGAVPDGWRTIESAPKDRNILLSNGINVSEGGWVSDIDQGAEYEGQTGMACWWALNWPHELGDVNPTHWQPLPAAPGSAVQPAKMPSQHQAWVVEVGAVALPLGHPSRLAVMTICATKKAAEWELANTDFDGRTWPIDIPPVGLPLEGEQGGGE